MRLFIAINLHDTTRSHLLALQDELRARSERGNFSLPENLHLTLAFLGECDRKQTDTVKSVMDDASFDPFSLTIDRIGRFKRDSGDIWWASGKAHEILLTLQRDLTAKLTALGFALDIRKYSPHITLGREVATMARPWQVEPFGETVTRIDLMKSERIGGKLTYTSIKNKSGLH